MLCVHHLGTGASDIGRSLSVLGVSGGNSFERSFHCHSSFVCSKIQDCTKNIIDQSFLEKIIVTFSDDTEGTSECSEKEFIINCKRNKKFESLPENLSPIKISNSYDMGWQKRAGGRMYDSLSGHGFFVGCRTKKS